MQVQRISFAAPVAVLVKFTLMTPAPGCTYLILAQTVPAVAHWHVHECEAVTPEQVMEMSVAEVNEIEF